MKSKRACAFRRTNYEFYVRLAEYFEAFLARTDLRMFGGSLEFHIGRQLEPMDKIQTDVWRLLQPRFERTSYQAWELPDNDSRGSGPVAAGPLPELWVQPCGKVCFGQGVPVAGACA